MVGLLLSPWQAFQDLLVSSVTTLILLIVASIGEALKSLNDTFGSSDTEKELTREQSYPSSSKIFQFLGYRISGSGSGSFVSFFIDSRNRNE